MADQDDLIESLTAGVKVETTDEDEPEPTAKAPEPGIPAQFEHLKVADPAVIGETVGNGEPNLFGDAT